MERGVLAFAVAFVLAVSGIATAGVIAGAGDDKTERNEQDAGVHGERSSDSIKPDRAISGPSPRSQTTGRTVTM